MNHTVLSALLISTGIFLMLSPLRRMQPYRAEGGQPAERLKTPHKLVSAWRRKMTGWQRRSQNRDSVERQALLRQLAALLRAGRQSHQVWKELAGLQQTAQKEPVGDLPRAIKQAALYAQRGEDTAEPFRQWWPWLASCFDMATQQGVPLADLLERYGSHLKEDQELDELVKVEAAGAKMTQRLLLILPLGGIGLSFLLGIDVHAIYFGHPMGIACLVAGAILSVLAARTSARIIRDAGKRQ